jgi:glycosyltransferase involved in cell wall biosynthesis
MTGRALESAGHEMRFLNPEGSLTVPMPTYPDIRLAVRTMVPTESQRQDLTVQGFRNIAIWSRGVDTELFRPREKGFLPGPRPLFVYSGRVAVEKNLDAFLSLDLPSTKYVIGDGPDMRILREKFPGVRFTGFKYAEDLACHIAAADVFVFPSRTDTFGLVLLEAMACGVPVAAYPIPGPADVVQNGVTGILDDDLRAAALGALDLDGAVTRRYAESRT